MVGEAIHPYMANWFRRAIIGYGDTFVNEYYDYFTAIKNGEGVTPNFRDGLWCKSTGCSRAINNRKKWKKVSIKNRS